MLSIQSGHHKARTDGVAIRTSRCLCLHPPRNEMPTSCNDLRCNCDCADWGAEPLDLLEFGRDTQNHLPKQVDLMGPMLHGAQTISHACYPQLHHCTCKIRLTKL